MSAISLDEVCTFDNVLKNGETISFTNKDETYYAHFRDGILINHTNRKQTFKSLTSFCNSMSGTSINGWKACKVYRDGAWQSLYTLRNMLSKHHSPKGNIQVKSKMHKESSESENDADIDSDSEMPPKKITAVATKTKVLGPPISLPCIKANIIESDEPTIKLESVTRIILRPRVINGIEYFYDSYCKRVYEKTISGVGDFVGIYNEEANTINQ